jgi:hypothetical protein
MSVVSVRLISGIEPRYQLCSRLGGPRGRLGRVQKTSPAPSPGVRIRNDFNYTKIYRALHFTMLET